VVDELKAAHRFPGAFHLLLRTPEYAQHRSVPLAKHMAATAELGLTGDGQRVERCFIIECDRDQLLEEVGGRHQYVKGCRSNQRRSPSPRSLTSSRSPRETSRSATQLYERQQSLTRTVD